MKKRLLFISTIFPSILSNKHATYNLQALYGLQNTFDIVVINPIPWHMKLKKRISPRYILNGLEIHHPTYWYPPKFLRTHYDYFYYLSIKPIITKLAKEKKPDIIYSSWLYPDGWVASIIADSLSVSSNLMAIGTDVNRLVKNTTIANKTIKAISRSKMTICVSNAIKNKLIDIGADQSKLTVLYNGVNREIFQCMDKSTVRTEFGFSSKDTLILFVGNLLKTKGLDELADAFNNLVDNKHIESPKLIIAGNGKYESTFANRLNQFGVLDRCYFMGSCDLPIVAKLMNAADIVCLPSYSEGLPNVVVEALCCNAKVVATDVGGIPELKSLHKNLYLVPAKDSIKLTRALIKASNSTCYEDKAEDIYTWEEYSTKLTRYFGY